MCVLGRNETDIALYCYLDFFPQTTQQWRAFGVMFVSVAITPLSCVKTKCQQTDEALVVAFLEQLFRQGSSCDNTFTPTGEYFRIYLIRDLHGSRSKLNQNLYSGINNPDIDMTRSTDISRGTIAVRTHVWPIS